MSNKTSDKNVANIEDDIELVKRYLENSAYKESNSDFFKNGGWEMVDLEIPKAMANILAELEQKDKRIQELEEENYIQKIQIYENSIPKQAVINKIEDLKLSGGSNGKDNIENLARELVIDILQEFLGGDSRNGRRN